LEQHWNGARWVTAETMLEWARSMTWEGISLSKTAMLAIEVRLERNPILPKWDILMGKLI